MSHSPPFLKSLAQVFSQRVRQYGAKPAGVLWKDRHGQRLRFEVLYNILNHAPVSRPLTIADLGCGYGAFFDFLITVPECPPFDYAGYDISPEMIDQARRRIGDHRASFHVADRPLAQADYTFVSGTYNLHVNVEHDIWTAFIKSSLSHLWARTDRGLAFNMLDKHHRTRQDGLYYADAQEFLDHCAGFSSNVTLIDDYPLDEWTLFIRR